MPVISVFFGIKIMMFWKEHHPPHFHAEYADYQILVDIENGVVIKGVFPSSQLKLVLAWCEIHRDELLKNWRLAQNQQTLEKIDPLK